MKNIKKQPSPVHFIWIDPNVIFDVSRPIEFKNVFAFGSYVYVDACNTNMSKS